MTDALSTPAIGAALGGLLVFVINEQPPGALILAAAALGAVLANAVRQALGPKI